MPFSTSPPETKTKSQSCNSCLASLTLARRPAKRAGSSRAPVPSSAASIIFWKPKLSSLAAPTYAMSGCVVAFRLIRSLKILRLKPSALGPPPTRWMTLCAKVSIHLHGPAQNPSASPAYRFRERQAPATSVSYSFTPVSADAPLGRPAAGTGRSTSGWHPPVAPRVRHVLACVRCAHGCVRRLPKG